MTDIFDQETQGQTAPTDAELNTQQQADHLAALVGEGKKYKTVNDLAKSRLEADAFIEQLKTENAGLRQDYSKAQEKVTEQDTLKDILAKIEAARQGGSNQPAETESEDIQERVKREVEALEMAKTARFNRETSQATVLQRFNNDESKAKEFMAGEAKRLNITTEMLGKISESSPEAFNRMLGLSSQSHHGSFNGKGNINTAAELSNSPTRNNSYYNKLRKEMGADFYNPKIQTQLFKDRMSMDKDQWDK
jgi:hypothetical protein